MVDTDAEGEKASQLFAIRRVQPSADKRVALATRSNQSIADAFALLARRERHAGERLRELGTLALGEVHDVDRRSAGFEEIGHRLVDRRLAVFEIERHRPRVGAHDRDLAAAELAQLVRDAGHIAERRRHEQELGVRQCDERDLPGRPAVAVGVVVKFVHHHVRRLERRSAAKRHVRQHLGRAAAHQRVGIDRSVAGQHADALGAEVVAEGEELFRGERLDRAGVEGDRLQTALKCMPSATSDLPERSAC